MEELRHRPNMSNSTYIKVDTFMDIRITRCRKPGGLIERDS